MADPPGINELTQRLIAFRDARDWRQFHTLRHLIVSVGIEAGELLELTQWKSDAELESLVATDAFRARLASECADVFIYLLLVCDAAGLDLAAAAAAKIETNEARYPADRARGSARKYTEL